MTDLYLKKTEVADEIMDLISEIVEVEKLSVLKDGRKEYPFNVVDMDEERGLYLVHYDPKVITGSQDPYLHKLRGTLVDVKAGMIVRETHGYTPTVVLDSGFGLLPDANGDVVTVDTDGKEHSFNVNKINLLPSYQGTLIFVTRNQGVTDYGTHRRINAENSWWADSAHFLDIYRKYNGPTEGELFDLSKPNSPICHTFQLVDKSLLMSSKIDLKGRDGFLLYHGYNHIYRRESDDAKDPNIPICKYDESEVDWAVDEENHPFQLARGGFVSGDNEEGLNPFVDPEAPEFEKTQMSSFISVPIANQILRYGYHPELDGELPENYDNRLLPGESVFCYYQGEGGLTMIQINSPAAQWRAEMVENNNNQMHRGCTLIDMVHFPEEGNNDMYESFFPYIANLTHQQLYQESAKTKIVPYIVPSPKWRQFSPQELLLNDVPVYNKKQKPAESEVSKQRKQEILKKRIGNVLLCYAFSVPLHLQERIFLLKSDIERARRTVIDFIVENEEFLANYRSKNNETSRDKKNAMKIRRFQDIIRRSRTYNDKAKNGAVNNAFFFKQNVATLLNLEYGISLYHLLTFVIKFEKEIDAGALNNVAASASSISTSKKA